MADMMMPEGMPMDPMMGGGMPPAEGMPMDPMMGGGMPPMDMMPPEGEAPMEAMGDELAEEGRGGDQIVGHLTPGEIVIPVNLQNEEMLEILEDYFADAGLSISQYTVGHESNSINPETGMPEFSYWGSQGSLNAAYNLTQRPLSGGPTHANQLPAPTEADFATFDRYMTNYVANRRIEERKIKELREWQVDMRGAGWQGGLAPAQFQQKYGFSKFDTAKMNAKKAEMAQHARLYQPVLTARLGRPAQWQRGHAEDMARRQGDIYAHGFYGTGGTYTSGVNLGTFSSSAYLTPYQRQGAFRHGERLGSSWANLSTAQKRKEFEDFYKQAGLARYEKGSAAQYGAGASAFQGQGEAFETEQIRASREQAERNLEAERAALEAQLREEEERRKAAIKKEIAANLRAARSGSKDDASTGSLDPASAVGSITDPRSMVAKSYGRRSADRSGVGAIAFGLGSSQSRPV